MIEKTQYWIWFGQIPSPRVLKAEDFEYCANPDFKDQCVEVVRSDYVTSLENRIHDLEMLIKEYEFNKHSEGL